MPHDDELETELPPSNATNSSDMFGSDDPSFIEALATAVFPGDIPHAHSGDVNLRDEAGSSISSGYSKLLREGLTQGSPPSTQPGKRRLSDSSQPDDVDTPHDSHHTNKALTGGNVSLSSYMDDTKTYGPSHFGDFGEYMSRKRAKLQLQNVELDDEDENGASRKIRKRQVFKGLAIYINGWTDPSVQDLRKLIIKHGGEYHAYLDRKSLVTHIITCALTPAKIKEFKHMKVVRPEWLVRSAQVGSLLPWRDFIYKPEERMEASQGRASAQKSLFGFAAGSQAASGSRMRGDSGDSSSSAKKERHRTPPETITASTSTLASHTSADETTTIPPSQQQRSPPRTPSKPKPKPLSSSLCSPTRHTPTSPTSLHSRSHHKMSLPRSPHEPHISHSTDPLTPTHASKLPSYAAHASNTAASRAMADPAWRAAHTSVSKDFIGGYYKHSRLHHLSSWKAELKELVGQAQERAERGVGIGIGGGGEESRRGDLGEGEKKEGAVSMRGAELVLKNPLKGKGKAKNKAGEDEERVIMHCDFDAFFVSAGLVDRPEMKGKPVVVCHSQGGQGGQGSTSEIASASYEARKFGIKNGMSLQQARKLCPGIQTIPYEFERYKELSLKFYTILMAHADDLQAVSVDEALIDVTSTVSQMKVIPLDGEDTLDDEPLSDHSNPAKELAEVIRTQVREATRCEVSIGISHNIMMARLATRRAKPAGSYHLLPEAIPDLLSTLDIQDLHGFGWSTKDKAQEKLGATNLGELAKKSKALLCDALGEGTGERLYNAIRGVDDRKLESDKPRKSVSCEINYGIRFENQEQAEAFVYQMAEEVKRRLDNAGVKGKSITMKVMKRDPSAPVEPPKFMGHGMCLMFNRQSPLAGANGRATSNEEVIGAQAWKLLKSFNIPPHELRGLGIQIQKLEPNNTTAAPEPGQARLPFKLKEVPPVQDAEDIDDDVPDITIQPASSQPQPAEEDTSNMGRPPEPDLPSFSQVDMSVFDALPTQIRGELEAEYKRRSISPAVTGPEPHPDAGPFNKTANTNATIANLSRITRQLAPRAPGTTKPILSPTKSRLFGIPTVPRAGPSGVRVKPEELKQLGFDPDVFASLPIDIQREELANARALKNGLLRPVKPVKPLKAQKVVPKIWRSPTTHPPRRPPPKAKFDEHPMLITQRSAADEDGDGKARVWEAEDVQALVGEWVREFEDYAPHNRDVDNIAKFLLRCVESGGVTGLERVVDVMRWWAVQVRRRWAASENVEVDEDEDLYGYPDELSVEEMNGRAWWSAYRQVKDILDRAVRKRFGGSLSLK